MKIRVILADDHQVLRQGLRALLEKEPEIEVIADVGDGETAVRLAQEMSPNVVVMDIAMPSLNGIEATHTICAKAPQIKVIALSVYKDSQYVMRMLKAGASGYVIKDCAFDELKQAIHAAVKGQIYLSPLIVDTVAKDYIRRLQKDDSSPFANLTARERTVLQLLAEGKSVKEIADYLCVTVKTIQTHRKRLMDKLGIHNIAGITKYAISEGLTPLKI